jgi:hypothetical protein
MKTHNILVSINNKAIDVITYLSEKKSPERELQLVVKLINQELCNVKSIEKINNHKIIITSEKETTYTVVWTNVILWNESELED